MSDMPDEDFIEVCDYARRLLTLSSSSRMGSWPGAPRWYQLLVSSFDELPEHVMKQADAFEKKGDKSFIRLAKSWNRAQREYRKLTGKSYDEG